MIPPEQCAFEARPLAARIAAARGMLLDCTMCEWRCGVDRTRGERAPCRLSDETFVFNQYLSLTEEREIIPALRVYLGGCNFRCIFCDTGPECFEPARGRRVQPEKWAIELSDAVQHGARTISILGGEPTLHIHTLLELAAAARTRLPLVINTNLYMTPEVLELLDGVVTLYLGDFKFGSDVCAQLLSGVPRYVETVRRNITLIAGHTPLIVRHLLMPEHFECCFRPVVGWLTENVPGARFQLYTGYVPCYRAGQDGQMGRLNRRNEIQAAIECLTASNLNWDAGADGSSTRQAS